MSDSARPRVLIVGGGYVGLYTALRLEKTLRPDEAELVLVTPENYMTYQPLLPEVASGSLEPRHGVVPLRKALRRTRLRTGHLVGLDHPARTARVQPYEGDVREIGYDHVVIGLGSMTRMLPVPGLAEHAVGFNTLAEAIGLRDQVLSRMEAAAATDDPDVKRRALTFVFVGGGYAGVEALAELESMARDAARQFDAIERSDMRWLLVEATDRILPTIPEAQSRYAADILAGRGIDIRYSTTLDEAEDGRFTLSDGEVVEAETLVWMAGVTANRLVTELGLPLTDDDRLDVDPYLRLRDTAGAWAAGDCAAVPSPDGGTYPPTAQHAVREGRRLGDNLAATLRGQPLSPFRYESKGELVTLGRHEAAGEVAGRQIRGLLPWLARRVYYGSMIPTANRKVRVFGDWLVGLPFGRDVVQLSSTRHPEEPLDEAAEGNEAAG